MGMKKHYLSLTVEIDMSEFDDLEDPELFFEEHFCRSNIVRMLADRLDALDARGCMCSEIGLTYIGTSD